MMKNELKVGSKLFCNWGAMYPTEEYVVIDFDREFVVAENEDEVRHFHFDHIKEWGTTSPNGSPIGVFLVPEAFH